MKQAITFILISIGIIITSAVAVQARDVPFTEEDRDRIIRTETKVDALEKSVNQRFEQVDKRFDQVDKRFEQIDKRFDQMQTFMLWGFGILFGGMGLLMGFVLWDRRTALSPAIQKTNELEEQAELLKKALKEAAIKNPDIKEALKHVGLL
jgi:hypothetical protein